MTKNRLRVGRIDYLNIWPIFESIKKDPVVDEIEFIPGHPSLLNKGLVHGTIDVSPSSSFEYLVRAEKYRLLPNLGISAENEVQSVLFCLPFSLSELEVYVLKRGNIRVSSASAASVALLKVLWRFYWQFPEPVWVQAQPGQSLDSGEPFLEIGDHALNVYLSSGQDLELIDLASEWKKFTGLPFVFALWIMNRGIDDFKCQVMEKLRLSLDKAVQSFPDNMAGLAQAYPGKKFKPDMITDYWKKIDFNLGPEHLTSLAVFGNYLTRLHMIKGMPVLDFN